MEHYFEQKPTSESAPQEIKFRIKGIDFSFLTDSGVFSKKQLDFGSELLIETVISDLPKKTGDKLSLLDLGCGYGAAGIVLKRVFPFISITMVDINERAVSLAKSNAERNLVKYANVLQTDVLDGITGGFDFIITNPPVRAGKKTVFKFYEQSLAHLNPSGILYVVIQRKQGAPSSEAKINELFGSCEVIEKKAGYWILKAISKGT
ncbi:MAG: class I SAM-dependent methyltransferase [Saccharofermentanales bacterium]